MAESSLGPESIITKEGGESRAMNRERQGQGSLEEHSCVRLMTLDREIGGRGDRV